MAAWVKVFRIYHEGAVDRESLIISTSNSSEYTNHPVDSFTSHDVSPSRCSVPLFFLLCPSF